MLLAIDIGSKYIHIAKGTSKGDLVKVTDQIQLRTPEEGISDGYIRDIEQMAKVIQQGLSDYKIKKAPVVFTIKSPSIIVRELTLPQAPIKELRGILEMEMMEYLNLEQDYLIDFIIKGETNSPIDHFHEQGETMFLVEAYAAPLILIEQYVDLAKKAKLQLSAIDFNTNALTKFVVNCDKVVSTSFIVAEIGNRRLELHLFNGEKKMFSREVLINTERYERNLVELGIIANVEKNFNKIDLIREQEKEYSLFLEQMTPYFQEIMEQINRMLQFQMTINAQNPVQHIYLCGGVAEVNGIEKYLSTELMLDVQKLSSKFQVNDEEICPYVNAIGALIRL